MTINELEQLAKRLKDRQYTGVYGDDVAQAIDVINKMIELMKDS